MANKHVNEAAVGIAAYTVINELISELEKAEIISAAQVTKIYRKAAEKNRGYHKEANQMAAHLIDETR